MLKINWLCPISSYFFHCSSEGSEPSSDVEQPEVTLIPPSELLPHGCGFESQVCTHVLGIEFGDEEEVV